VARTTTQLLDEALDLPDAERADLVIQLLSSLNGVIDQPFDEPLRREIERRVNEVREGRVATIPWMQARQMIAGTCDAAAAH